MSSYIVGYQKPSERQRAYRTVHEQKVEADSAELALTKFESQYNNLNYEVTYVLKDRR